MLINGIVWGNAPVFRLKTEDFKSRIFSEGIPSLPCAQLDLEKIPRTISEAILATRVLRGKYLWVDSLCIIQDDENEMKTMIHAMDRVYKSAVLTIIAADGDNANSGLPGLFTDFNRSNWLHVPALSQTTWGKRGWTYQEYHFSRRVMIFANNDIFYQCREGAYDIYDTNKALEKLKLSLPWDPDKYGYGHSDIRRYNNHVEEYTGRQLSFEHDVLNAFTAILEDAHTQDGITFCWGLPIEYFSHALLWKRHMTGHEKNLLRRRHENQPGKASFPSWSWVGWIGKVELSNREYTTPEVIWPWQQECDVPQLTDVVKSGVLTIRAYTCRIFSFPSIFRNPQRHITLDDSRGMEFISLAECILIASRRSWYIFLVVERGIDGVYFRKGIGEISKSEWDLALLDAGISEKNLIMLC